MDGDDVVYSGGGGNGGGSGTYNYNYSSSSTYWYAYSYTAGGGGGGGSRTAGKDGARGNYSSSGYWGAGGDGGLSTIQRGYAYNAERTPNMGGAGGGAGGGGGGAVQLQSAGDVNIASTGKILADGGDGGEAMRYVYSGGGGGAGGSIKIVATAHVNLDSGATISVQGGQGGPWNGTYTYYQAGTGGRGGDGYIRLEAVEDENSPGKPIINGINTASMTYGPPSTGVFAPVGGGAPSIGQTLWRNLSVVDPVMSRPGATDVVATLYNDSMTIEVQMAVEDPSNLGNPDLSSMDIYDSDHDGEFDDTTNVSKLSEWTRLSDIEQLNGRHYQFIRIRVSFQLDSTQRATDPLPYLDSLTIPFGF